MFVVYKRFIQISPLFQERPAIEMTLGVRLWTSVSKQQSLSGSHGSIYRSLLTPNRMYSSKILVKNSAMNRVLHRSGPFQSQFINTFNCLRMTSQLQNQLDCMRRGLHTSPRTEMGIPPATRDVMKTLDKYANLLR